MIAGEDADRAPGDAHHRADEFAARVRLYAVGLALAAALTAGSFAVALYGGAVIYGPAVAVALIVFAIAQMGVHLVFFLHVNTGPDSTNNVLALAFGILIVFLVLAGSIWIMANLNSHMMPEGMPATHRHGG